MELFKLLIITVLHKYIVPLFVNIIIYYREVISEIHKCHSLQLFDIVTSTEKHQECNYHLTTKTPTTKPPTLFVE